MYLICKYFGISGTFKGTTITSRLNKEKNCLAIWSDIKVWKSYEREFNLPVSNLNYAALHLIKLKNYIYDTPHPGIDTLLVERGVSDMIFYDKLTNGIDDKLMNKLLHEEDVIVEQYSYYSPINILLIQKDIDFIRDVILKEKSRSSCFPGGVEEYLRKQDEYIKFTKEHNDIKQEINIKDAEKYIVDLGLTFDPNINN